MLKFYISFWKEYRHVLLDGKLTAKNPENDFSQASSTLDGTAVTAVYTNNVVVAGGETAVVVNASGFDSVIVKNATDKNFTVISCTGEALHCGTVTDPIEEISVPKAGILIIKKQ